MTHRRMPTIVIVAAIPSLLFMVFPMFVASVLAFGEGPLLAFPPTGLGMQRVVAFLDRPDWMVSLRNSAVIAVFVASVSTVLGAVAGWRLRLRSGRFVETVGLVLLLALPVLIPRLPIALGGALGLRLIGATDTFLGISLMEAGLVIPLAAIAAMVGIDEDVVGRHRFARAMGATPGGAFLTVVVPSLGLYAAAIWLFLALFIMDESVISLFVSGHSYEMFSKKTFDSLKFSLEPAAIGATGLIAVSWLLLLGFLLGRRGKSHSAQHDTE